MALVKEDGTGIATANAYASYTDWTAHWADRGTAPTGTQTDVEQALVRGADYLDRRYRWVGQRETSAQGLQWPRLYAYRARAAADEHCVPVEGVPLEVVRANVELAERALAGDLAPDPVTSETGQTVVSTREKVGPLETAVTFTGGSAATWVTRYPFVDELVRPLVVSTGGRVHRA